LGGVLSPSLLELNYLNYLDLSNNDFQGMPIPNFIGSLNKLSYLNLSSANFSGTIPPHLGNLSNLLYLDLSTSVFLLPLSSLNSSLNWLSGLSSLQYLSLTGVNLWEATNYWLQTVNLLPSLLVLDLSDCQLDYLPQTFPSVNFTSLSVLDLSYNVFISSSSPQWLFNITSLTNLNLEFCYLKDISGDITEFFQALLKCSNSSLEELNLGRNQLIGNLPQSLGYFKRLRKLQLSGNSFYGSIPSSIQNLSRLEIMDLRGNMMN
jgi:hypothetical protein